MGIIDDARAAGFSESEIGDWANSQRDDWRAAGFSDQEIDQSITGRSNPRSIPQAFLNRFMEPIRAGVEGFQAGYGDERMIQGLTTEQWKKAQGFLPGLSKLTIASKPVVDVTLKTADVLMRTLNAIPMAIGAYQGQDISMALGQSEEQQKSARHDWAQMMGIAAILAAGESNIIGRRVNQWGEHYDTLIGKLPTSQDFTDAAKTIGGDIGDTRQKLVNAYEQNGMHPAEAAADPKLADQKLPEAPISEPPPTKTRSEMALTGDPNIDMALNNPTIKRVIDNPRIIRDRAIPYEAGGSEPLDNSNTYVDKNVPASFTVRRLSDPKKTVSFDPAEPATIHENVEEYIMEELIKGGMKEDAAYRVAHWRYANPAEEAWYRANDIDPVAANEEWSKILPGIQRQIVEQTPFDLYRKVYPGDDITKARHEQIVTEKPSLDEIGEARGILQRTYNETTPEGIRTNGGVPPATRGDAQSPQPPMGEIGPTKDLPWSSRPEPPTPGSFNPQPPKPGQPYFSYDDRPAWRKWADRVVNGYVKTFQPELVSDAALTVDPRFAEYKSRSQSQRDAILKSMEDDYQTIRGATEAQREAIIKGWEKPKSALIEQAKIPEEFLPIVDRLKQMMESSYWREKIAGSQAEYVQEYLPHIYQDPVRAGEYMQARISQLGPRWFQKERVFETISDALDQGLRLKSTNVVDLITHRLIAGADMIERMNLLNDMRGMGLATEVEGAPSRLASTGWSPINAPSGKQWLIAPDIQPLWKNAVEAKGLWANQGAPGTAFRGWMGLKNVWVPIKLVASLFHPLHVLHINYTQGFKRAWTQITKGGDLSGALESVVKGFTEPIRAAIPGVSTEGKIAREAWKIPEKERTPEQQAAVTLMHEGGFVPELSEQFRIDAKRAFEAAKDNHEWWKTIPIGIKRAIELVQAPVFQEWIPNLKTAAYLRDAQALLARRPELLDDKIQRGVALRTISKSIDNRYGEMNYGGLFWNRYVKDSAIGSFLSLGWNLGFAREFGGSLLQPVARTARRIARGETETEATIRDAQDKMAFVVAYSSTAMLINGAMNYGFTGEMPDGLDWFLPRVGGTNPDGSPRRLNNMFYTREVPMAAKHVQEKGPLGGMADMLWNKTMFQPIKEMLQNRSYYGADIWDENGPIYRQAWQMTQHIFKENFSPMSVTGASRALNTGGHWWEAGLSYLGFGPAPGYVSKTPIQNFITHEFQRYVSPTSRPAEEGEASKTRGDIRTQILLAKQRGDNQAMQEQAQAWFKAGGSRQGLSNILLGIGTDVSMFRALPESSQRAVMERASPEERAKYAPYLKEHYASKIADMIVDREKARNSGNEGQAEALDQQIADVMRQGVQDGHITNKAAFQNSVRQQLISRYTPELGAILAQPKRMREQYIH